MSIHVFLATACALVSSVLTGSSSLANTNELCVTPNNERSANCNRITLMYFYNGTSKMCQHFRWRGCDREGVFETRHQCVSHCNKDQGAPFCADPPPNPCKENEITKRRERFYYNITIKACLSYNFCGGPQPVLDNNHFIAKDYCRKQCVGFDENTARAKNEPKAVE
uniref:BPTI/Kunitz inhibitor domain-containing protein n=1 Tax=Amblyomma maculatum TaxID=34609 RepID=G3MTQ8_AMBMU